MFEDGVVAFTVMGELKKYFNEDTFFLFERWLNRYVSNWAHCDFLSSDLIGCVMGKYPKLVEELKKWTVSKKRWVRRSAAVSLVVHARRGNFLREIFYIAGKMMKDKDDMVQKGVGWVLKEASKRHEKEVINFLMKWKKNAPRLVLRYATEKVSRKNKNLIMR
jgi:3-methyladenine DNA glycosylase AlkD